MQALHEHTYAPHFFFVYFSRTSQFFTRCFGFALGLLCCHSGSALHHPPQHRNPNKQRDFLRHLLPQFIWPTRPLIGRFHTLSNLQHEQRQRRTCLLDRTNEPVSGKISTSQRAHQNRKKQPDCRKLRHGSGGNLHLRGHRCPVYGFELIPVGANNHTIAVAHGIRNASHICEKSMNPICIVCARCSELNENRHLQHAHLDDNHKLS